MSGSSGRSGSSDFGDVFVYDPATDSWSDGPPIDPPRGTAGAVVACDTIVVVGGESQSEKAPIDEVLRLDPTGAGWESAGRLPEGRSFARTVSLDGAVYVVGGSTDYSLGHSPRGVTMVSRAEPSCSG